MKKSFFLLVPAAFGLLMMSACSDDSSAAASNSNQSSCALNPSETGLEINCNGESYGFLKTSSKGVYGSCGAEALKDDSGYKLVCGGDSVGVVYNGIRGRNGENGTNGLPGPQGEQGANGSNGAPGASCRAEQVATGFELYCGEEKVGTILNGSNGKQGIQGIQGYSCSVEETLSGATIECEDGTDAVITNGLNGENCTVSGLLQVEEDDESEFFGQTYNEITCDGEPFRLYNGTKGAKGDGCSAEKDTKTGVTTITCGDDEAEILDGAKGADGKSCSIVDNTDGTATITCETDDGDVKYTVTNGTNGYSCSSTVGVGYVDVKCQTGVDDDGIAIYETNRILAAGFATCGTGATAVVYNTLTDTCTGSEVLRYICGKSTELDEETQFCYEGQVYAKADYWTVATTYPKTAYFWVKADEEDETVNVEELYAKADYWTEATTYPVSVYGKCGTNFNEKATEFCEEDKVYEKADYWTEATDYPKATYGQCGNGYYKKDTEFCSAYNTIVVKCGEKEYEVATQYCQNTGTEAVPVYTVTNIYGVCGADLYDTRTHECSGEDVVEKSDP